MEAKKRRSDSDCDKAYDEAALTTTEAPCSFSDATVLPASGVTLAPRQLSSTVPGGRLERNAAMLRRASRGVEGERRLTTAWPVGRRNWRRQTSGPTAVSSRRKARSASESDGGDDDVDDVTAVAAEDGCAAGSRWSEGAAAEEEEEGELARGEDLAGGEAMDLESSMAWRRSLSSSSACDSSIARRRAL